MKTESRSQNAVVGIIARGVDVAWAGLMALVVVIPIMIGFVAGVVFALGVRMWLALREAFAAGQRLING